MGNDKLVLIGGGGHCKSVLDAALKMNKFSEIVITDSNLGLGSEIRGCKVAGTDDMLPKLNSDGFRYAFVTVGSVGTNHPRKDIVNRISSLGFVFPTIIDPSAVVSDSVSIGAGTFIGKNVVVNADTKIGDHCIINTGAIIEHECKVGDFSHVSVGSILCGEVEIGKNSFIGAGSTVIQCINIGDNVTIGANSTVLTDVEGNMKYYGIVTKNLVGV